MPLSHHHWMAELSLRAHRGSNAPLIGEVVLVGVVA